MLSQNERLRKKKDFDSVFKHKCSVSVPSIVCYVSPNQINNPAIAPRTGFVVGKKVNKLSTKRNLIKRRMREAYRALRKESPELVSNFDAIIFIARPTIQEKSFSEIKDDIHHCLKKVNKLVLNRYVNKNSSHNNKNIPETELFNTEGMSI